MIRGRLDRRAKRVTAANSMELILNRDSVAASDFTDSHERRFTAPGFMTLRQLLQLVEKVRYLPTIGGGKATWSAWAGRPLAVLAQEWEEPKFVAPPDTPLDVDPLRVHFSYHALAPPMAVYTEVLQGSDRPATPRRPSLVSGENFIAEFLAETAPEREDLIQPGLDLARALRNEAVALSHGKRTEYSSDIPELFFTAAKIALLVLQRDSSELQRHERDLLVYLQKDNPRKLLLDYERFKKELTS